MRLAKHDQIVELESLAVVGRHRDNVVNLNSAGTTRPRVRAHPLVAAQRLLAHPTPRRRVQNLRVVLVSLPRTVPDPLTLTRARRTAALHGFRARNQAPAAGTDRRDHAPAPPLVFSRGWPIADSGPDPSRLVPGSCSLDPAECVSRKPGNGLRADSLTGATPVCVDGSWRRFIRLLAGRRVRSR
jgi:hypothetical protein